MSIASLCQSELSEVLLWFHELDKKNWVMIGIDWFFYLKTLRILVSNWHHFTVRGFLMEPSHKSAITSSFVCVQDNLTLKMSWINFKDSRLLWVKSHSIFCGNVGEINVLGLIFEKYQLLKQQLCVRFPCSQGKHYSPHHDININKHFVQVTHSSLTSLRDRSSGLKLSLDVLFLLIVARRTHCKTEKYCQITK